MKTQKLLISAAFLLAVLFTLRNSVAFAQSEPLTLHQAVAIALRQHGSVGSAEKNYDSAREGITSARSSFYPQVTGSLNYNYQNGTREVTNGFSSSYNSSDYTSNLSITQDIFNGGQRHATVQRAKSAARGAFGSVGAARNSVAFKVATAFYAQLRDKKLVAQRQAQVSLAKEQLAMIQAQVDAGTAAQSDVQSVQVNLSQAQFDLVTAQNNLRTSQTVMRQSLGLGRGAALTLQESALSKSVAPATKMPKVSQNGKSTFTLPPMPPLPKLTSLKSVKTYLAEAQKLRPDLLQADASVRQSEAQLTLSQIARRPNFSVTAGYNIDPFHTDNKGLTFGAGVTIPIFDGGRRKADVKAARDNLKAGQIQLSQLQKDAAADVETTYVDVSGEVQRIKNARALVESARTNFQTTSAKCQLGLGVVLDVVNAQTQLFSAQTSLTQAIYDYQLALADLNRAVGRFAWANPGKTPPKEVPKKLPKSMRVSSPR